MSLNVIFNETSMLYNNSPRGVLWWVCAITIVKYIEFQIMTESTLNATSDESAKVTRVETVISQYSIMKDRPKRNIRTS